MRSACSAIGPIRLKSVVAVVVFVAALDFDGDVEMVVANCWCVIVVVQPTEFHLLLIDTEDYYLSYYHLVYDLS